MNGKRRGDDGFSLVELLVVVAILGVLAMIVTPAMAGQRHKAHAATLRADLRAAATAQEAWAAEWGTYIPAGPAAFASLVAGGFRPSRDVTVTVVDDDMAAHGGGYCLRAEHALLPAGRVMYLAAAGPEAGRATPTPCVAS